jgi:hypothetical protein
MRAGSVDFVISNVRIASGFRFIIINRLVFVGFIFRSCQVLVGDKRGLGIDKERVRLSHMQCSPSSMLMVAR